ncbi:hypothetical protein LA080_016009 [Diaporthe eres]|nr:hypothetical protein LA080_016009 [Diaporthe eres]
MLFPTLLTLLTISAMGVQPGSAHGVITSTDSDDCYMPCDEQGVWIGPRSDVSGTVDDTAAALKRFEDELAEFESRAEISRPVAQKQERRRQRDALNGVPEQLEQDRESFLEGRLQ